MNYAFAGCPIVGAVRLKESQLERLTRRLRTGWRSLIETLKQKGNPS